MLMLMLASQVRIGLNAYVTNAYYFKVRHVRHQNIDLLFNMIKLALLFYCKTKKAIVPENTLFKF